MAANRRRIQLTDMELDGVFASLSDEDDEERKPKVRLTANDH